MQLVHRVAEDGERRRAESLAASERRVAQCEAKLSELESYQANYANEFAKRASLGIAGVGLREYQAFLGRLAEAVRQQGELLARARAERDAQRQQWQGAAQRADIIGKVVERGRSLEQREHEAQEQRDSDERAQNGTRRIDASRTQ